MTLGITVRDGTNTPREITGIFVRDGGNVQREISAIYVRDTNNVSRLVYNPSGSLTLAVTSSPGFVGGIGTGTGIVETDTTTATASNGTPPYTYAWTLVSYTAGIPPTASDSAAATTSFIQTGMSSGTFEASTWRVTATDANSNTATFDVSTSFSEP